jgi:transcriptional regulator with XRE-family HTH domain
MGRYDPSAGGRAAGKGDWQAEDIRALRRHLGLSQQHMADELGTRQQTVSEWETGLYRPRGASARLLTIIAERAGFEYEAGSTKRETGETKHGRPDDDDPA